MQKKDNNYENQSKEDNVVFVVVLFAGGIPQDKEAELMMRAALEKHDEWMINCRQVGRCLVEDIHSAAAPLIPAVQEGYQALQEAGGQKISGNHATTLHQALEETSSLLAEFNIWVTGLAVHYQPVAMELHKASLLLLHQSLRNSVQWTQIEKFSSEVAQVIELGQDPDESMLKRLKTLGADLKDAGLKVLKAEYHVNEALIINEPVLTHKNVLQEALSVRRSLHHKLEGCWSKIYALASRAFPDLPVKALELSAQQTGTGFLSYVDATAARLLTPMRSLSMYEDKEIISSVQKHESRHNVFLAHYGSQKFCLKQFDLGSMGDETQMRKHIHAFQKEITTVSRLEHDNVIKAHLFFLEVEHHRLNAYVQYQYFPLGSMASWLGAKPADPSHIRIVLFDALKGLEHGTVPIHLTAIVKLTVAKSRIVQV